VSLKRFLDEFETLRAGGYPHNWDQFEAVCSRMDKAVLALREAEKKWAWSCSGKTHAEHDGNPADVCTHCQWKQKWDKEFSE